MLQFDSPQKELNSNTIKVIGVGGGGSNAVNHMYRQGIKDVDFYVCNTDAQALNSSPVPNKIQIGKKGTGAGSNPEMGKISAQENINTIQEAIQENCNMLFITAGMGGGTGTGAAPVIAEMAKKMDILTVAIVTLPFSFEGKRRLKQANEGINELKKHVDGLLIINNDKIRELYGNLSFVQAFQNADNILCTAASGIAQFVTKEGFINGDFEDVKSIIKNAGRVIMGTGYSEGENRAIKAVEMALNSPLLDDNDIAGAKDMLLYIISGTGIENELTMDEFGEITDYIKDATQCDTNIIHSIATDEELKNRLSITCIVAGFEDYVNDTPQIQEIKMDIIPPIKETPIQEIEQKISSIETINFTTHINNDTNQTESQPQKRPTITDLYPQVQNETSQTNKTVEIKEDKNQIDFTVYQRGVNTPQTNEQIESRSKINTLEFTPPVEIRKENSQTGINNNKEISWSQPSQINNYNNNIKSESKNDDYRNQLQKLSSINFSRDFGTPAFERRNVQLVEVEPANSTPKSNFTIDSNSNTIKENSFLHKSID